MDRQPINDYFIMLGKVFEWICYESKGRKVGLAMGFDFDSEKFFTKPELCIKTIMDSCKHYDEEHGTDYYNKFMFAKDNGVDYNE